MIHLMLSELIRQSCFRIKEHNHKKAPEKNSVFIRDYNAWAYFGLVETLRATLDYSILYSFFVLIPVCFLFSFFKYRTTFLSLKLWTPTGKKKKETLLQVCKVVHDHRTLANGRGPNDNLFFFALVRWLIFFSLQTPYTRMWSCWGLEQIVWAVIQKYFCQGEYFLNNWIP